MNPWAHLQYSAEFISPSLSFPTKSFPDITVSIVRQKLMSSQTMLVYLAKYQPEVNQYHYKQKKALLLPTAYLKSDSNCPHFSTIKKLLFKSGRITKEWACPEKTKQQQKRSTFLLKGLILLDFFNECYIFTN